MQTVLVSCIGKKIPRWFLPHSSKSLRIRPIWSSSIKMAAEDYTFGPYKIHHTEVFYSTHLSYAMVNLRPLLPGHVLVCPKREVKRFVDLTADETSDLWLTAQKVGKQLESYHKASSLTLAIQMDEKEKELKQKLDLDKERKDRTLEEMSQEADEYRKLFV
ncbi:bifunctional bis(5'-adenosyl)-triphosphatase/adenylylsulfatase FHIT isoform X2 [Vigna radiata var. radiata]|uniref:Bifunctional bis(5'-adenosyl)-triphosphatase/adenylylsulfatase FHIT isoform X2 n=1 Tax=Vigna radiata var. radiata TaxID=3916 RepID=A0A3Q0FGJ1_VIGRR|nr:bifunctional bis(5'-adenosyl)-triphosphatase/adenylylsulfatase FHIT isoform X2 [Vigna radiata var. radiata]